MHAYKYKTGLYIKKFLIARCEITNVSVFPKIKIKNHPVLLYHRFLFDDLHKSSHGSGNSNAKDTGLDTSGTSRERGRVRRVRAARGLCGDCGSNDSLRLAYHRDRSDLCRYRDLCRGRGSDSRRNGVFRSHRNNSLTRHPE